MCHLMGTYIFKTANLTSHGHQNFKLVFLCFLIKTLNITHLNFAWPFVLIVAGKAGVRWKYRSAQQIEFGLCCQLSTYLLCLFAMPIKCSLKNCIQQEEKGTKKNR